MRLVVALLLSFAIPALALAADVTLQHGLNNTVTSDAKIASAFPSTNFGSETNSAFVAETSTSLLIRFAIFQAEGGPVPNGATITSATLSLYKTWGPLTGSSTFKARRLLRDWSESQANWNQAASGVSWQSAGAFGSADVSASADGQGTVATDVNIWLNIDVTAGVQAFAGGTPNYGWKVSYVSGGDTSKPKSFNMKEYSSQTLRPKLSITYDSVPPPPPSGCNSGTSRPYSGSPINGKPIPIANPFEAEHFNCGGEGQGYHDLTQPPGPNSGQDFRADEGVQIYPVATGGLAVNQFDLLEWMVYTVDVPSSGNYDLAILASSNWSSAGSFRIEIDGADKTGQVTVPITESWENYQWITAATNVFITAGADRQLKLVSMGGFFRTDKIRVSASGSPPPPPPPGDCSATGLDLCIRFEAAPDTQFEGIDFNVQNTTQLCAQGVDNCVDVRSQSMGATITWAVLNRGLGYPSPDGGGDLAYDTSRVRLVDGTNVSGLVPRDGSKAIMFTTQDLDQCVHTSDCGQSFDWERSMMNIYRQTAGAVEGAEQWWAHSVFFPTGMFSVAAGNYNSHLFYQWHGNNRASGQGQPNISLDVYREPSNGTLVMRVRDFGGSSSPYEQFTYQTPSGNTVTGQCIHRDWKTGVWYDFVHHIKWSSNGTGFHHLWMREDGSDPKKVLAKTGMRNLYAGSYGVDFAYLSIGAYHTPQDNVVTSVIHDRYRRGNSFAAVANFPQPSDILAACP